MKQRITDKHFAIQLRRRGKSFDEIRSVIPNLPKSTLSGWFKDIELTDEQLRNLEKRIQNKLEKARFASAKTNREKRIQRTLQIFNEAKKEFPNFSINPLFLVGLSMYWAEGSKRGGTVEVINSDIEVIKLMIKWFNKFLGVPVEKMRFRLYTHKQFAHEESEKFWARELDVNLSQFQKTVYKFSPHNFKKRPDYRGCLRIVVGAINKLRKIFAWQKALVEMLKI